MPKHDDVFRAKKLAVCHVATTDELGEVVLERAGRWLYPDGTLHVRVEGCAGLAHQRLDASAGEDLEQLIADGHEQGLRLGLVGARGGMHVALDTVDQQDEVDEERASLDER